MFMFGVALIIYPLDQLFLHAAGRENNKFRNMPASLFFSI